MPIRSDYWKIDGGELPSFCLIPDGEKRVLQTPCFEGGVPFDSVTMEILGKHPEIALITAIDGRGTNDGSPPINKFVAYSNSEDNKHIMTTYQAYLFEGPLVVQAYDSADKIDLLDNVDMYHVNINPDRTPDKVIETHLRRIHGKRLRTEGLSELAERTFLNMIEHVAVHSCIWTKH